VTKRRRYRTVTDRAHRQQTATDVGKGVAKVGAAVPMLSTAVKLASRAHRWYRPLTYGASPLRCAAGTSSWALTACRARRSSARRQTGGGFVGGENLLAAAKKPGHLRRARALRFAAMSRRSFPHRHGRGRRVGAADALADGQPITQALIAGVRGAIPGGAIAQAAFDTAAQLAQGKKLDEALLTAARNRLPPGPAQAAFDTGLAIAQGKKVQEAMLQGAGSLLPSSPYSADAMTFARRALAGEKLGQAALSTAGQAVLRRARQQGTDLVATVQGRGAAAVQAAVTAGAAAAPRQITNLNQAIAAADQEERRRATQFATTLLGAQAAGRISASAPAR
jgi:hypothetical protein